MRVTLSTLISEFVEKFRGIGFRYTLQWSCLKSETNLPYFSKWLLLKKIKYKTHGGKHAVNSKVENFDKEGNTPCNTESLEYNDIFSLFWNFQHLLEFEIVLLPISYHDPHLIHLSNSNS